MMVNMYSVMTIHPLLKVWDLDIHNQQMMMIGMMKSVETKIGG